MKKTVAAIILVATLAWLIVLAADRRHSFHDRRGPLRDLIAVSQKPVSDSPAYHNEPPRESLPPPLDSAQFSDKPSTFVAYAIAARIPEVLYQVPCACPCHKTDQHQSLYDCFRSQHGLRCEVCQREAMLCFRAHQGGASAAEIRRQIVERQWTAIDPEKYAHTYLADQGGGTH